MLSLLLFSSVVFVVGTVKTASSSCRIRIDEGDGSTSLLFMLLFFLSSTHPFSGLESSVMDKPNVPATIPPIKNGKFSRMTSKMSSSSSFSSLLFEEDDDA
tara:strand:- start:1429 stop:1731 length:303 start_codon:yes stop_codon:yes gene_type:complete